MTQNKIIIISGLPGSGKSTLAEALAKKLALPLFSVDPIESAILQSGIKRSFRTGLAAYLVAEKLAAEQLKLGSSVIIDAVSPVAEARKIWTELAKEFKALPVIIECILKQDIHKKRLAARVRNLAGFPEITWKDVEESRQEFQPWQESRLLLDTSYDQATNLNKALEYIRSFPGQ